jgi:hypothetical protein
VEASAAAKAATLAKLRIPPPLKWMPDPLEPGFVADAALQTAVDDAIMNAPLDLTPHAFAIVDLTDNPLQPAYAGYRDAEPRYIASLGKLLPFYGAFQLRRDLQAAWPQYASQGLPALAAAARENLARVGASVGTRPLIEKLFAIDSAGNLDFSIGGLVSGGSGTRHKDKPLVETDTDHLDGVYWKRPNRGVRTTQPGPKGRPTTRLDDDAVLSAELNDVLAQWRVPAEDHLRLMVGWSDNISAAIIIQALGFPYLWALTTRSGLYRSSWKRLTGLESTDPMGPAGMWLSSDYNYGRWRKPPGGFPTSTSQGGSARSIATLMTMLARDQLVDSTGNPFRETGNVTMREMLRKDWLNGTFRHEGSQLGWGLHAGGWGAIQPGHPYGTPGAPAANSALGCSKVGSSDGPGASSNALIVRTTRAKTAGGQKTITAVLVGLNSDAEVTAPIKEFGKQMAAALDQRHGLATTTSPTAPP